ncbi:MAG: transcription antitermination factor NusB [Proteobacteria bacterium]|nr:transcription antitermination factor NusB [Pseudomonadota bacterium]
MKESKEIFPKKRSVSRLAAVQALYQIFFRGETPALVIRQFTEDNILEENLIPASETLDVSLFSQLVLGVFEKQVMLDDILRQNLSPEWPFDRIDPIIIAILRCGLFEILTFIVTPIPVIISEYIDVGHAFCGEKEAHFINGLLDRLARTLRS